MSLLVEAVEWVGLGAIIGAAVMVLFLRRPGFRIGQVSVTWRDLWTGNHGLEIYWPLRFYRCWGFGKNPWEAGPR